MIILFLVKNQFIPDPFNGNNMNMDIDDSRFKQRAEKPQVMQCSLPVSLEDLFSGCTKKLKITRKRLDDRQILRPAEILLKVDIKSGYKVGTKIKFAGEGDALPGNQVQDLVFIISEKPHARFSREGNNLIAHLNITLKNALCGGTSVITGLDEKPIHIVYGGGNSIVKPNDIQHLVGKGMPISKVPGTYGDLIVKFNIQFPSSISLQQKEILSKAL